MKSDARLLLNQKRLKTAINRKAGPNVIDARKILNSRLRKKTQSFQRPASSSQHRSFARKGALPNVQRTMPHSSAFQRVPEKRVKLSEDGNILITARSKALNVTNVKTHRSGVPTQAKVQNIPLWTPTDIDTVDVEHVGIGDVLDMDSLPSATIGSNSKPPGRSLGMRNTMIADQVATPQQTVMVCVYNLHVSVSKEDIMELFGDVEFIKHAEMVQPGTALIEFFDPSDATKACQLYHNRLLDGQAMQCYVQPANPQRSSFITQRLGDRIQSGSPIPSTSSFPNSRSMYNPRNVRFTVKLT